MGSTFLTPENVEVPAVTADGMRAVDRTAVDDVGLDLLQMMENAGRTLAWHARDLGDASSLVIAGNGGNGGGGLACARHLANRADPVDVVLDRPPADLTGAAAHQYGVLAAMGLRTETVDGVDLDAYDVIVDAVIGYGLSGAVRPPASRLIDAMNGATASVVSLDVPSGIDATSGEAHGVAVRPDRTVTLALPKTGLVGRAEPVYLADIGIPRTVYDRLGLEYHDPFGCKPWVELSADH